MIKVLVVEDSMDDLFLLRRAFAKLKLEQHVEAVIDGDAAISYLEDASKPRPSLVLLDLHMPKRSGFEVLAWIRAHPDLKSLPVVILTSSNEPNDLKRAYDLGVNGYMVKPGALDRLDAMVRSSSDFWLNWNQVPSMA